MPVLFKTLFTLLYGSDEVRQLYKFDLRFFSCESPNIGNTSAETYSIFYKDKLFTISTVRFSEDYKDRVIAILPFYDQYDF